MALVQHDARRFFCYLFLSHSALVLVGLEAVTPIGLTGALCVWLTVGMSLGGLGLTLRALEARRGRLSLTSFQGMYDHTPDLAVCFLLTGLASVGFPGMAGFVGAELLVDGVVEAYPLVGVTVVIAAALAGIAVVKAYFLLFTGPRHQSSIPLQSRPRLRWSMLLLIALVMLGGWFPQPGVKSRHEAATELLAMRAERGLRTLPEPSAEGEHDNHEHADELQHAGAHADGQSH
jgi:NADH-quinone oxidoreductase subunit M